MSQTFSALLARFRANPAAVKAEFQGPVLLWESTAAAQQEAWERTVSHAVGAPRAGDPLVFRLVKANHTQNAFAMGVTVGRVGNNDITLPDDSVSRFHAFFQRDDKSGGWTLTDAESKNGTFLGEQRLEANQHVPLADGAKLRFGDARVEFLLPATLLARLAG